jgi:hypothetical protein
VLFDVPAPGSQKIRKQWKRYVAQARELATSLARGRKPVTVRAVLDHARAVGHIVTRKLVGRASRALTAIGSDALLAGRGIKRLHAMAMWEYAPRDCSVPVIHFIAADQPVSTQLLNDPRMGWQEFARAGLAVHWLKGDHNSIFRVANAAAIAEQLQTLLRGGPLAVNPPAPLLALAAKK